jgi:hypothetical protein
VARLATRMGRWVVNTWLLSSTMVGWFATEREWGRQHDLSIMLAYTLPFTLFGLFRVLAALVPPAVGEETLLLRRPRAEATGFEDLTELLKSIYQSLSRVESHRLRITLFFPDVRQMRLVQIARYCWDEDRTISSSVVRFGTGAVGHAYNRREIWYMPSVTAFAGLLAEARHEPAPRDSFKYVLTWCGMVPSEASTQQSREAFVAVPVICTGSKSGDRCIAVVAVDAEEPIQLGLYRQVDSAVAQWERSIVDALGRRSISRSTHRLRIGRRRGGSEDPPSLDPWRMGP